jgi:hypothetical protein
MCPQATSGGGAVVWQTAALNVIQHVANKGKFPDRNHNESSKRQQGVRPAHSTINGNRVAQTFANRRESDCRECGSIYSLFCFRIAVNGEHFPITENGRFLRIRVAQLRSARQRRPLQMQRLAPDGLGREQRRGRGSDSTPAEPWFSASDR